MNGTLPALQILASSSMSARCNVATLVRIVIMVHRNMHICILSASACFITEWG